MSAEETPEAAADPVPPLPLPLALLLDAFSPLPLPENPVRVVNHVHTKKAQTPDETPNQHECGGLVWACTFLCMYMIYYSYPDNGVLSLPKTVHGLFTNSPFSSLYIGGQTETIVHSGSESQSR